MTTQCCYSVWKIERLGCKQSTYLLLRYIVNCCWRCFKYQVQIQPWIYKRYCAGMMTSSNGNIFRVTGPLCGEFTGHRWIPLTKAIDAELWFFLWSATEQTTKQTVETQVIWDAIAVIMKLWPDFNSRKTPISRPNGRTMGVFRELFGEKWPRHFESALYFLDSQTYPKYSWFPYVLNLSFLDIKTPRVIDNLAQGRQQHGHFT